MLHSADTGLVVMCGDDEQEGDGEKAEESAPVGAQAGSMLRDVLAARRLTFSFCAMA